MATLKTRIRPFPHYKFPDEIQIECFKMKQNECLWHNVKENSYELRCTNYGWFPNDAIMGTIKGKYSDTYNIGAQIGGNMGTAGMAVVDIHKAIEMLNNAGYYNITIK